MCNTSLPQESVVGTSKSKETPPTGGNHADTHCEDANADLVKLLHYNLAMHTKKVLHTAVLDSPVASEMVALQADLFQTLNTETVQRAGNVEFTGEETEMNCLIVQKVDTIFIYRGSPVDYMQTRQTTPIGNDPAMTISCRMRTICVDWVAELCGYFGLSDETLFLTVYTLDRFLALRRVKRTNLQLVTVACCLYAARFAQCNRVPTAFDLSLRCGEALTGRVISRMATEIMELVSLPSTAAFYLPVFLVKNSANIVLFSLASYLLELTLLDYNFCLKNPVMVCAASIMLARQLASQILWTAELEHVSSYTAEELAPTAAEIFALHNSPNHSFQRIKGKNLLKRHSTVVQFLDQCAVLECSLNGIPDALADNMCTCQSMNGHAGIDTLPNSPAESVCDF